MNDNTYEYEIDLKDLMFVILRNWRKIIVVALVAAFLLGGYKCIKEFLNQKDQEYVSTLKEEYESDLTQYEQTKKGYERDIDNFTSSIAYQEKYKENSILLKTDPYNKGVASTDVFIKMSEQPETSGTVVTTVDFADGVVKAYASAIQQGGALEALSRKRGIDLIYLKELVTVTTDYDSNMLNVSITYPDEDGAEEILDQILDSIDSMYPEIQEKLGEHSVVIMNHNIGVITDQNLANYQKQKVDDLADTNTKLTDTEKSLKELKEPEKPVALSKTSIVIEGAKFGVLGGVVGAFLMTAIGCMFFLFCGKLGTDNDLKNRYGLKLLGAFSDEKKKRMLSGIDNWLDRLEGKVTATDEAVLDKIAVNINNYNQEKQSVFITGTTNEKAVNDLVLALKERLPQLDIEAGLNMNVSVNTLKRIAGYDQIILVETRRHSRISQIEKEMEIIRNMKKEVLGYVVLKGM